MEMLPVLFECPQRRISFSLMHPIDHVHWHNNTLGFKRRKPFKRYQMLNELTFEKVTEQAGRNQVLVFVHSRKDTAKTARFIRDKAVEQNVADQFITTNPDVLRREAENSTNADLKNLLPFGFGIHHAGMTRSDRLLVERMFREGQIQVLIATATLAWGVNLPAHRVIIKGTQVYSPNVVNGSSCQIKMSFKCSVVQVVHSLIRRERASSSLSHAELQYYLSLLNQQLPIESQFVSRLVDHLNAEIVLGTIKNVKDGCGMAWMYLFECQNAT